MLVVEDDAILRDLMERLLGEAGYRMVAVGSAEAAIGLLKAEPLAVDLVITDYGLPGMGGAELIRWIAARHPELPIISTSGWDLPPTGDHPPAGVTHLHKPFTLERMLEAARAALAHARRTRPDSTDGRAVS